MNYCCENCGWSEITGSSIMCHYKEYRTWCDECCEAWKPKECYEPKETDYECLKRIFTKAGLIINFNEYNGMFDNKIIVFLNSNELHLNFDKNTQEILPENKTNSSK